MRIISWEEFIDSSFKISKPASITIGVFDGVHRGHNYLLNKLKDENIEERVVFTFIRNPVLSIKNRKFLGNIYTLNQKLPALEKAGVTTAVLIDFSSDFSKLKGEYFIRIILEHINMKKIVLGKDFKCGVNNSTTSFDIFNILKDKDIETVIVNRQNYKNIPVSSSDIRKMIISGNTELVSELLPYGYSVDLSGAEIISDSDYFYIYRDKIEQLLPDSGRFLLNLEIKNITSQKEVFIENRIIKWFNR
jgi:riboflavin kinase/FMN adenylyltransferase